MTAELRKHSYVKDRFDVLAKSLSDQCKTCDSGGGFTAGWRVATLGNFLDETPVNMTEYLNEIIGEKVIGAKQVGKYPLVNYLGSYTLHLYYRNVDCVKGRADVLATATNDTTWQSFTRVPGTKMSAVFGAKMHFYQIFEWRQRLSFTPNSSCCKCDPLEPAILGEKKNPFGSYP